MQTTKAQISFCGCAGRFVSYLVANPEDGFSRDKAHMILSHIDKDFYRNIPQDMKL